MPTSELDRRRFLVTLGAALVRDKRLVTERQTMVFDLFPILKERLYQQARTMSGGEQRMLTA